MIINNKALNLILRKLQPAIHTNPIMPILEYIKVQDGKIMATNLNLTILHKIDTQEEMLLPFQILLDLTIVLEGELNITDKHVLLSGAKNKHTFGTAYNVKDYPASPSFKTGSTLKVNDDFFTGLSNAAKCVWKQGAGSGKECVYINFAKGEIAATDAHSLYRQTTGITADGSALVDTSFIRACADFTDAEIKYNEKFMSAKQDELEVICTLTEGRFPDYSVVIPSPLPEVNLSVSKSEFIRQIKTLNIYKTAVPRCDIFFKPGCIDMAFRDVDIATDAAATIECNHAVTIDRIAFNMDMLLNLVSNISGDIVNFCFIKHNTGIIITEENKLQLLMPLMLE